MDSVRGLYLSGAHKYVNNPIPVTPKDSEKKLLDETVVLKDPGKTYKALVDVYKSQGFNNMDAQLTAAIKVGITLLKCDSTIGARIYLAKSALLNIDKTQSALCNFYEEKGVHDPDLDTDIELGLALLEGQKETNTNKYLERAEEKNAHRTFTALKNHFSSKSDWKQHWTTICNYRNKIEALDKQAYIQSCNASTY